LAGRLSTPFRDGKDNYKGEQVGLVSNFSVFQMTAKGGDL
jgi:hypothetical protein